MNYKLYSSALSISGSDTQKMLSGASLESTSCIISLDRFVVFISGITKVGVTQYSN